VLAGHHFPLDHGPLVAMAEAEMLDQLLEPALEHRLGPVLMDVLETAGLDVPAPLRERVTADRVLRLRSMAVLARAAVALDEAGLRWAVFKGPVVASFLARPELRRFNDLDILVPGTDLGRAIEVLGTVGIEELNRNWDGYVEHRVGEVPMTAGPVNIDLHWQIVGLGVHRRTMNLDPAGMLDRCRRRLVGQSEVSIFAPEDQLLHLALHSALSGAKRLDQLRDIAVLCEADGVDWQEFADLTRGAGVARLVAHALDRSRVILGAEVNSEYLCRLGGRSIGSRRRFDQRRSQRSSDLSALLVSLWRDNTTDTLRSTTWLVKSRVRSRLGRGIGWDAGDIDGVLYYARESGGASQREAFLRGAAQWD